MKEEEDPKKKAIPKKTENEPPKLIEVQQKLTCYNEFDKALKMMKEFDVALAKMGYLKSQRLQAEAQEQLEKEQQKTDEVMAQRAIRPNYGRFEGLVENLEAQTLPEVPYDSQNAIVINLFCVDEIYESRSLDFV